MGIKVITNNVPRDLIEAFNLPIEARSEFDWLNWESIEKGEDSASFFRYKGQWYCLSDITVTPSKSEITEFKGWAGYNPDSFFSGILIRWPTTDYDSVVVARYYTTD